MIFLNPLRRIWLVTLLALSTAVRPASAEPASPAGPQSVAATCDLAGHRRYSVTWSPVLEIPDNDPSGITTPPIQIPYDGSVLWDVAIEMFMRHSFYSDFILTASYDLQCDGIPDVSVDLLYRPCQDISHSSFGCGISYVFSDRALAGVLCTRLAPAGCYLPTRVGEALPALRAAFNGLPTGGCFTLTASDNALYWTGYLCGMAVYTSGTLPVPTLASSWGALKLFYR